MVCNNEDMYQGGQTFGLIVYNGLKKNLSEAQKEIDEWRCVESICFNVN